MQRQNCQGYFDSRGIWPYSENSSWMNKPSPRMNPHLPSPNSVARPPFMDPMEFQPRCPVPYSQAAFQPINFGFNGGFYPYQPTGSWQPIGTGTYTEEQPPHYGYQVSMRNYSSPTLNNEAYRYN